MSEFTIPTEKVTLPSKGLIYPTDSELSKGHIEMKYMTAKEEDILLNQRYIKEGIAIDKLLQSLVVTKFDYNDLILGDKNAIMVAARVLGYGGEYKFNYGGEEHDIDLSQIDPKPIDESLFIAGKNEFEYVLPFSKTNITFKILTHKDETKLLKELEGLKKINKNISSEISTRMKYIITSIDNDREIKTVRDFVDKKLLARDSQALRKYLKEIQPDIDLTFFPSSDSERVAIPIGVNFFWPDV